MVLIKSISGIRGTIHANDLEGLTSLEVIKYIDQFANWIIQCNRKKDPSFSLAVGRDGRVSGSKILTLVIDRLLTHGFNVIDLGLTTTPSLQLATVTEHCLGAVMISASHNPSNWNGLKFLNMHGEFLSKKDSLKVFATNTPVNIKLDQKGCVISIDYIEKHIHSILELSDVDVEKIKKKKFKIVVDGINSSGGIYVPFLLSKFNVDVIELNCVPDGLFAHDPEPIPKNLHQLSMSVKENKADLGIAVDPDVDRLVLVCEDGSFFSEENTVVAIVKYIVSKYPGSSVVSNLSTTQGVKDVATQLGSQHFESSVGEINVVELMKKKGAIIGGEGSGGIIFPQSHYGRDALVGISLLLSYLSSEQLSMTELKSTLPTYYMIKHKVLFQSDMHFDFTYFIDNQIKICKENNQDYSIIDGIKIYYKCGSWGHIRCSNTEPAVRLIIESPTQKKAREIKKILINDINQFLK